MFSDTSTGMNLWPLWTPKVRPTNCGKIVDRRDQVRITWLRPERRASSAFFSKYPSTNGPFHTERVTSALRFALALVAAADDEPIRRLVAPRLLALGRLAPGRHRMAAA